MLQIFKKISFWFTKQAKKEITLFPKTKFSFSFKPFHIYQGIVIIALVFVAGSFFIFHPVVDKSLVLKNAITKPISAVVAGQPIKYTLLVKSSDITEGQYLAQLPKSAENIQVNTISLLPGEKILTQTRPINTLTLGQRKILAERIKPKQFLASAIDSFNFLFADLEKAISHIVELAGKTGLIINRAETAVYVDISAQLQQNQEYVAVEYEVEPTNIEAQDTKTGKRVTISSTEDLNQPKLTDVVAYSVIPEIYNVGQENKIKIKWTNNSGTEVPFNAFDLDNNGKIDYVEWLVPHLSTQTFEIIYVSKAYKLDVDKNPIEDIYDKVKTQDNIWATIENGQYVKATFEQTLGNSKDITIHAKPTSVDQSVKIEVYSAENNQLVAVFKNIDKEGNYTVYINGLSKPTDTFNLKVIGNNIDIDYIVDPIGWLTGWSYRKKITISKANVDTNLSNFPLYVKLTADADVGANALVNGVDIRFTDSGGTTLLSYEQESWTGEGGASATANLWVKVPTISTSANTDIYMYYGKAGATSGQDVLNVWDTNYKGVWHYLVGGIYMVDSTVDGPNGSIFDNFAYGDGKINGAFLLDGSGDYASVADNAGLDLTDGATVSVWYKFDAANTGLSEVLVSKHDAVAGTGYVLVRDIDDKLYFQGGSGTAWPSINVGSVSTYTDTDWHLVVGTVDGTGTNLYIDGVSVGSEAGGGVTANDKELHIGNDVNTGGGFVAGLIDEVRVSNVARTASWIKFEYNNQNSVGNELTFATQEVPDTAPPTITGVNSDKANGSYKAGEVIDIDVTFSEVVTSTGDVTVTLETGDTDRNCAFSVSSASTSTCDYTVQAGDTTSALTVKTIAGTIADEAGNAMTNLVPATNLATNKNIIIDTTPPVPSDFSPASASTIADTTQTITFTTDENATCKVSLTDQAYGDMTGDACTGGGTTSQSCTTPDLGSDGAKNVYVACIDTATNADTADTNENLTYTLSTDSENPTVSAGDDRAETSEFTQTGTATDDSGIATYAWSMVSGPGTISFGSASSVATTISASGVGTYVIRLTVTDTADKSTSDDFSLTWGSSVVGSGISSQPAVANQPSAANQVITQAQEQVSNITQQITELVGAEKQITYPPIEESVTEEAPIALQGWDVMELKPVEELSLNPMDSSLGFFASKIPQFNNTLTAFGIDSKNTGDIAKIGDAQLYLPGLSQIVATTKTIPTDIVFAMSPGELLDYSMAVLVDANGNISQRLETIAGKSMDLVIKPEKPAKRVTGYITLKKSGLGQAGNNKVLGYITRFLTAGLLSAIDDTNSNVINGESLLLGKFSYAETSSGVFKASVQSPENEGEYEINTVIEYQDVLLAPKETSMTAIVNPEGYVYAENPDGRTRIKNASVSLLWLNPESSQYELWPADKFLQQNPVLTDETGRYSFLVPEGTYKLIAEAPNYLPFESGAFVMKEKIGISVDIKFERKPGTFSWPVLQTWHYMIILLSTIIIAVIIVMIIKGRRKNINSFG